MAPKSVLLSSGHKMPLVGLGTWRAPDDEVEKALEMALEIGYRHIDTAPVYLNEKAIGHVLKKWIESGKVKREDLFICTKLPPHANRAETVEKYLTSSLKDLQLDYVDLYLIHTPFTVPETDGPFLTDEDGHLLLDTKPKHIDTWQKMEEMVNLGLTKSIGISNFNESQIQRIVDNCKIKPACLQVENHLYLQQHDLMDYCEKNNIAVVAYSPLGSKGIEQLYHGTGVERQFPDILSNSVLLSIAEDLKRSPAQVLLRYSIQRNITVIPKSTNIARLKENFEIFDFELSDAQMDILKRLDKNFRICDFSFFKGIHKHPEFPWQKTSQKLHFLQLL